MRKRVRSWTGNRRARLLWLLLPALFVGAVALGVVRARQTPPPEPISLDDLALRVRDGEIASIRVVEQRGTARSRSGQELSFYSGQTPVPTTLTRFGVRPYELAQVDYAVAEPMPAWVSGLIDLAPLALVVGVALLFWRRLRRTNAGSPTAFGRSRARVASPNTSSVTFADVAGVDEAREELLEVVEFLREPAKFAAVGARIPRGVLLVGPPGTGKTLLARAVAGEGGVRFLTISGSEFVEMFVGVGASRVRDLFEVARKSAPCIVFVDEIDAVGRRRGAGVGQANDEREQTLNQVLVEMDGFDDRTGVMVIAATNRPDVLDPALLRPGRFDRVVVVPAPDVRGRLAILDVHARGKPLESTVSLATVSKQTAGFSGADLANVLNEGAILAARRDKRAIGMAELEEAINRVSAGPERKSRVMSDREKQLTAYHESGHAIVARFLAHHDPVHTMTIIPRGLRGGYTRFLPVEDRVYMSRAEFADAVTAALGGHAAESVVFGEMSTGAGDDIRQATAIVGNMVKRFGMSDRLGPVAFGRKQSTMFLGGNFGEQRNYSNHVGEAIDDEMRRLLGQAYANATVILRQHRDLLDQLARGLLEHESLDASEVARILEPA